MVAECLAWGRHAPAGFGFGLVGRSVPRPWGRCVAIGFGKGIATWLILPVVICLSQRLSHACVSINSFVL